MIPRLVSNQNTCRLASADLYSCNIQVEVNMDFGMDSVASDHLYCLPEQCNQVLDRAEVQQEF